MSLDTCREQCRRVPTLSQGIARLLEQILSVFNQLRQFGIERVFGRRSAPFSGVEGGKCLKSPGKMTLPYLHRPLLGQSSGVAATPKTEIDIGRMETMERGIQ